MKANEAPKRIWIDPATDLPKLSGHIDKDSIEYTRTDAFIEKAVSYLNSKLYDWVQTTNPNQRSCANTIMKQDFIEEFRKYMEG